MISIYCPNFSARVMLAWEMFTGIFQALFLGSVVIHLGDISLGNEEEK